MKIKCTVEILTLNSEGTLIRCLESVRDFDDILVIDGNSTDNTVDIAHKYGARVISQFESEESNLEIMDFSLIRNKGIQQAKHRWFLFIDSDEYLSDELVREIRDIVERGDENDFFVYKMPRKYVIGGSIVERSSTYPNYQVRFFYLPAVYGFVKKVHEKLRIKEGYNVGMLKNPEYVPIGDIQILKKKWRNYARIYTKDRNFTLLSSLSRAQKSFKAFLKQLVKYLLFFFRGHGKRLPFAYEWNNAYYHIIVIKEIFLKMLRKDNY